MKNCFGFFLLFLLSIYGFSKDHESHSTTYQFIQNNGQFHSNSLFRADIPSGQLYIEKNALTYHFYDANLRQELHDGTYTGDLNNVHLNMHAYKATFKGANPNPQVSTENQFRNYYNFFLGNDKSKWAGNVPAFGKLHYSEMYPGIDFIMYSYEHLGLKYDLVAKAGSNPSVIEIEYEGVDSIFLRNGKLVVVTSLNETWEEKPVAFQMINGNQKKVNCKYVLQGQTLSFEFPNGYDSAYDLVIDPTLVFSSYTGATSNNFGYTATYDKYGFLYSGSSSFNPGYPTTLGAYQSTWAGGTGGTTTGTPTLTGVDMAITKWDTTGSFLIFSTYLGGSSDELPHSLVVTDFNELYVMGTSGSINYPVTSNAFDTSFNINPTGAIPVNLLGGLAVYYLSGADLVISKFDSSGMNLDASTFLGGTHTDGLNDGANKFNYADEIRGEIDLDQDGKVYIATCTRSSDNPVDSVGFQTTKPFTSTNNIDGIVFKMNHNLTGLEWTNYLGGSGADAAYSIAIDESNNIFVTGGTQSSTFPVTVGAYDLSYNGGNDGFVTHITGDGTSILHSSFYGTTAYDQSYFVELDNNGDVFLLGQTSGSTGSLISNAAYNDPLGGQFIVKFNPSISSIIWATRFGSGDGTPDISPTAFLVDLCNAVYISGWGSPILGGSLSTTGLDTAGGPIQGTTDGNDFYVMVLSDDASSLVYATYFGGSAFEHVDGGTSRFDRKGKIYQAVCAGCGGSNDFPTTSGAYSANNGTQTGCNLAVFKMDFLLPIVVADFTMPTIGCAPFGLTYDNLSITQSATTFIWDFGDGNTSTQFEPSHIYTSAGVYTVTLIVSDTATCNLDDTLSKTVTVLGNTNTVLPTAIMCDASGVQIGIPQNNDPNLTYTWFPDTYLSDTSVTNPIATPPQTTTYLLIISNGICSDTISQTVMLDTTTVTMFGDSSVCSVDAPFLINSITNGTGIFYVWSNFSDFSDTINNSPLDNFVNVQAPDSINWYYLSMITGFGCVVTDSFKIEVVDVQNPIIPSFTNPGPGCAPYTVNFANTTVGSSQTIYQWYFGNGYSSNAYNASTTFTGKGNYPVTLIIYDSSICPQTDTLTIYVEAREDSAYTVTHLACANQDTEIGIPADTIAGTTYTWIPTLGLSDPTIHNPIINTSTNQTYLLIVQHVCVDSVTDVVTAEPISAMAQDLLILCSDNTNATLMGSSNGSGITFVWSSQSNFSDTLNTALWDSTLVVNQTIPNETYYFRVVSPSGCIEEDTTQVVVSDLTIDVSPDRYICQGDTIQLIATNNFPDNVIDFFWSPAAEIIGPTNTETITVAPLINTSYYVSAINDSGCVFKDTVLVEVSILSEQMVTVSADLDSLIEGTSTMVYATPASGFNYSWEPSQFVQSPNASSTLVYPEKTTTFTCTVSDPRNTNCAYKNDVTIRIYEINCGEPDIFIPNAFTPNYDGEHDEYRIQGQVVESLELKIYNRWGQLVFETNDKEQGWDGKFKGDLVDPAVFVYHLDVTCIDGQQFLKKGNITVIR